MKTQDPETFNKWVLKIFGDFETYHKSLPRRLWFQTLSGKWGSIAAPGR